MGHHGETTCIDCIVESGRFFLSFFPRCISSNNTLEKGMMRNAKVVCTSEMSFREVLSATTGVVVISACASKKKRAVVGIGKRRKERF